MRDKHKSLSEKERKKIKNIKKITEKKSKTIFQKKKKKKFKNIKKIIEKKKTK